VNTEEGAPPTDRDLPTELPALDPLTVGDDSDLALAVETWALSDVATSEAEIDCFETALQGGLDPARWQLANRLLGLIRAAADDRLVRGVRWGFENGRRFPLPSTPEGGRS
jgi:hypothetical protein